jgi:hypothetical protein
VEQRVRRQEAAAERTFPRATRLQKLLRAATVSATLQEHRELAAAVSMALVTAVE